MTGYKVFMGDLQLPVSFADDHHENKRTEQITPADIMNTNILKMIKPTGISFKAELPEVQYSYGRSAAGHGLHVTVQRVDGE